MTKLIDILPTVEDQLQSYIQAKSRTLRASFTKDADPLNVELSNIGSKNKDDKANQAAQTETVVKLIGLAKILSFQGSNELFKMCHDLLSTDDINTILTKNNMEIPQQYHVVQLATSTVNAFKKDLNQKGIVDAASTAVDGIVNTTLDAFMRPGEAFERMIDKETPLKRLQQANELQSIINLMKHDFNKSLVPETNKISKL